ncbi:hypothetical protein, partial [Azospirillum tabaci]|uniref:hypothetical protein n=1 Tax=Azospirillum tabaci TaxID=2752310 RepID=UPI001B3BD8E4
SLPFPCRRRASQRPRRRGSRVIGGSAETGKSFFHRSAFFPKTAVGSGAEGNGPPAIGRLGSEAIAQEAFKFDLLGALRHLIDRTNIAAPVRSDHAKKHGGGVSRILTVAHPKRFPCHRLADTRRASTTTLILIDCDVFAIAFRASAERKWRRD